MPEQAAIRAVLSLGSNREHREETVLAALHALDHERGIEVVRVSALYETEPIGERVTGDFINAVCIIETQLDPDGLLGVCKSIERDYGRCYAEGTRDRPLDIDIVVYADRVIRRPGLIVPHRSFRDRLFVLEPLCEIAPDLVVPPDGVTVREIHAGFGAFQRVRRISTRSMSG